MSQFYARYVPTRSPVASAKVNSEPVAGQKRSAERQISRKPKKSRTERHEDVRDRPQDLSKPSNTESQTKSDAELQNKPPSKKSKSKQNGERPLNNGEESTREARNIPEAYKTVKRRINSAPKSNEVPVSTESVELALEPAPAHLSPDRDNEPHQGDKAGRSRTNGDPSTNVIKPGLEPFPQPSTAASRSTDIAYSVLPPWMEDPILVDETAVTSFDSYELDHKILDNLQDKKNALPIQNTVVPLLLNKAVWTRPDLCVSAVTGSGKTLAYVLPIVQSLSKRTTVRLRAVVAVPTRALVKQVWQTFEACSRGMDLKITTAEGGRTLEEEQKTLVDKFDIYDPEEYQRQQQALVDWTEFSLGKAIRSALSQDRRPRPNFVTEFVSKADILIATPGRLIEHLQATEGFNLDDVEWFIADEADRLLNESYHEWLETVLPALQSRAVYREADTILGRQRLKLPERRVTKILLSATMTSDISKLLQMDLLHPKLITLRTAGNPEAPGNETQHDSGRTSGQFDLPLLLEEIAVPLKDVENKPLYLLQVLQQSVLSAEPEHLQTHGTNVSDLKHRIREDQETSCSTSESDLSEDMTSTSVSSSAGSHEGSSSSDDSTTDSESGSGSAECSSKRANTSNKLMRTKVFAQGRHRRALIFTRSTESASRLARLLSLLDPRLTSQIASFSSSSTNSNSSSKANTNAKPARTNKKILAAFATGAIRVLISTDLGGRGLDIAALDYVINYDVPASVETYVHRVGRTARAGRKGTAFTLLEHRQGKWFWDTIGGKGKDSSKLAIGRSQKVKTRKMEIDPALKEAYEQALQKLGDDVKNG